MPASSEKRKTFLDDLVKPFNKFGKECTPGGTPRYQFWFGRRKDRHVFVLYKFNTYRTIIDPPECVVTSFTLKHFVKSAKQIGLHISKAEQRALKENNGQLE